jgi:hypothetical protein
MKHIPSFFKVLGLKKEKIGGSYEEMGYKWLLFKWIGPAGWIISETPV